MWSSVDVVIKYATPIGRADWEGIASILTDPIHIDFSEAGLPLADLPRSLIQRISWLEGNANKLQDAL